MDENMDNLGGDERGMQTTHEHGKLYMAGIGKILRQLSRFWSPHITLPIFLCYVTKMITEMQLKLANDF